MLMNGVPLVDMTSATEPTLQYVATVVGPPVDAVITVTPFQGNATVYVLMGTNVTTPGPANYVWTAQSMAGVAQVYLSQYDPNYCVNCSVAIAVTGPGVVKFSIVFATRCGE